MRVVRVYINQPLAAKAAVTVGREAAHHLLTVLRAKVNDPVVLFNGDGYDYRGRMLRAAKTEAVVEIQSRARNTAESALRLTLAQGITRGNRMDYSLQKAVELGVTGIVPVICNRTEVNLSGKRRDKRLDHWRGVIVSACEQSGRASLPELHEVTGLGSWLGQQTQCNALKLVLDPTATTGLANLDPTQEVILLIGPEGGLSDAEIRDCEQAGFVPLKLGPRVLRAETAGPAAIAALQTLWGDLA